MTPVVRLARVSGEPDLSLLTRAELGRWDRLRDPRDRAAYAAAHVLARVCAAKLFGCAPDDVVLSQRCHHCGGRDHGRPQVLGREDVSVSLSHTRGAVAAIASFGACGIDVEARGPRPVPRGVLSAREGSWVGSQDDPDTAFLRLWVRKEAIVKCGGGSLAAAADLDMLGDGAPASTYGGFVLQEWTIEGAVAAAAIAAPSVQPS